MKIRPILHELKFGGDVAENDANLDAYFVETSAFLDVISDESDLIIGPKGSGKTAIFRRIADPNVAISELEDVDVIPAFNIQGSVIFRRLTSDISVLDEAILRTLWMAYILGLVGNHLVETYSHIIDTDALRRALTRAGLLIQKDRPRSVWDAVLSGLRKMASPSSVETSLTFGDSGSPILTGKAEFDNVPRNDSQSNEPLDLEDLLAEEYRLLEALDRRCWVVFDRLDEAFQHDRDLERIALRGLLRAHLDICSYGRFLRTKLFLRTDILNRITEQSGFVNVTHIQMQRIIWDFKSIVDLVAKRIIENEVFQSTFNLDPSITTSEAERRLIALKVLPRVLENQDIFSFIIQRTTDAHDEPNPRNVLTLLRLARIRQLQICDRDDPDLDENGSLIGPVALSGAVRDLSKTRLEDTLFAEFNQIRPYVEKLRGRQFSYNGDELAKAFGLSVDSEEFGKLVEDVKYSGFMRGSAGGRLSVPLLYRPGLNLQGKREDAVEKAKQAKRAQRKEEKKRARVESRRNLNAALELYARQMAKEVVDTGTEKDLGVLGFGDRKAIHEAIESIPGVTSESVGEGPARRIILKPIQQGDDTPPN